MTRQKDDYDETELSRATLRDLVFHRPRVPVETLVDFLKDGCNIDGVVAEYSSVDRLQVEGVLELYRNASVIERPLDRDNITLWPGNRTGSTSNTSYGPMDR